jgi:hypothetical protein
VVRVLQAEINPAANRLAALTSINWLDFFNFMRIFRYGA